MKVSGSAIVIKPTHHYKIERRMCFAYLVHVSANILVIGKETNKEHTDDTRSLMQSRSIERVINVQVVFKEPDLEVESPSAKDTDKNGGPRIVDIDTRAGGHHASQKSVHGKGGIPDSIAENAVEKQRAGTRSGSQGCHDNGTTRGLESNIPGNGITSTRVEREES